MSHQSIPDYLAIARRGLQKRSATPLEETAAGETLPIPETLVDQVATDAAIGLLNRAGARIFYLEGKFTVGLWPTADTSELRYAVRVLWPAAPVVHLDDPRVPARYRDRPPEEPKGASWSEWKADMINRLFERQGVIGQRAHITASTVQHGEQARRAREEAE